MSIEAASSNRTDVRNVDLINEANDVLPGLTALERMQWAVAHFPGETFALTSAGTDSAMMGSYAAQLGIEGIFIDTGDQHAHTLGFVETLRTELDWDVHTVRPSWLALARLERRNLDLDKPEDLAEYRRITKLEPLSQAVRDLGAKVLLAAVRSDQTGNREKMGFVEVGPDDELRVHPFLDWTKKDVFYHIQGAGLPRNPLFYEGVDRVDDVRLMGRADKDECGLHTGNLQIDTPQTGD